MSDIRVPADDLINFICSALNNTVGENEQIAIFAKALLWNDLVGRDYYGISRFPGYYDQIKKGLLKCPCSVNLVKQDKTTSLIDGDNGLGHFVAGLAMETAIESARKAGIGVAGIRNSNNFGTAAYYVYQATQHNMVGIALSNSVAEVAALGGLTPVLGRNVLAFGAPRQNGKHIMIDLDTSEGSTPDHTLADAGHNMVSEHENADKVLSSFAGAKGYCLSVMIEILSAILTDGVIAGETGSDSETDNGYGKTGHFFVAIDIEKFMSFDDFNNRMDLLLSYIRESASEQTYIRIPGETRWDLFEENNKKGVALGPVIINKLEQVAQNSGTAVSW